jgi:hypothetical protein
MEPGNSETSFNDRVDKFCKMLNASSNFKHSSRRRKIRETSKFLFIGHSESCIGTVVDFRIRKSSEDVLPAKGQKPILNLLADDPETWYTKLKSMSHL